VNADVIVRDIIVSQRIIAGIMVQLPEQVASSDPEVRSYGKFRSEVSPH